MPCKQCQQTGLKSTSQVAKVLIVLKETFLSCEEPVCATCIIFVLKI